MCEALLSCAGFKGGPPIAGHGPTAWFCDAKLKDIGVADGGMPGFDMVPPGGGAWVWLVATKDFAGAI